MTAWWQRFTSHALLSRGTGRDLSLQLRSADVGIYSRRVADRHEGLWDSPEEGLSLPKTVSTPSPYLSANPVNATGIVWMS